MAEIRIDSIFNRFAVPDDRSPEFCQVGTSLPQRRRSVTQEGSTLGREETAYPISVVIFSIASMAHSNVDMRNLCP